MRLIDLDEFAELSRRWVPNLSSVEKATNENDIWDLGYLECLKVLDACHVYENVITVEWINKWWKEHFTIKEGYDDFLHYLGDMLEDWEEENETVSV